MERKLMIVGIDGATFDLIKPWAEEGSLPNFKRLLEEGCHGKLKSTIPQVQTLLLMFPPLFPPRLI